MSSFLVLISFLLSLLPYSFVCLFVFLNRGLRSWAEGWCCEGWFVQDEIDRVYLVYIMYLLLAAYALVRNTFNLCSGSSDRSWWDQQKDVWHSLTCHRHTETLIKKVCGYFSLLICLTSLPWPLLQMIMLTLLKYCI